MLTYCFLRDGEQAEWRLLKEFFQDWDTFWLLFSLITPGRALKPSVALERKLRSILRGNLNIAEKERQSDGSNTKTFMILDLRTIRNTCEHLECTS